MKGLVKERIYHYLLLVVQDGLSLLKTDSQIEIIYPHANLHSRCLASVIREYYKEKDREEGKETVVVSIMPCTAKKAEAAREEFKVDGVEM